VSVKKYFLTFIWVKILFKIKKLKLFCMCRFLHFSFQKRMTKSTLKMTKKNVLICQNSTQASTQYFPCLILCHALTSRDNDSCSSHPSIITSHAAIRRIQQKHRRKMNPVRKKLSPQSSLNYSLEYVTAFWVSWKRRKILFNEIIVIYILSVSSVVF
jgi:hypothetical protein